MYIGSVRLYDNHQAHGLSHRVHCDQQTCPGALDTPLTDALDSIGLYGSLYRSSDLGFPDGVGRGHAEKEVFGGVGRIGLRDGGRDPNRLELDGRIVSFRSARFHDIEV